MKRCPSCNRTYADDTQVYCLEDGSVLHKDEPQPTIRIAGTLATPDPWSPHRSSTTATPQRISHWPIYVLVAIILLLLGGGLITFLILAYSNRTVAANTNQSTASQGPLVQSQSPNPSPSPTPTSQALVGVWRTNVNEDNEQLVITVTFKANGTSRYLFRRRNGRTDTYGGTWEYSDETLFEKYPSGVSGKCAIRWIDQDTFELTILDNGVPEYAGRKRLYKRISQ